jgi:hypothetical protein
MQILVACACLLPRKSVVQLLSDSNADACKSRSINGLANLYQRPFKALVVGSSPTQPKSSFLFGKSL